MSNSCGNVRTVRIFVEPIDVELDDDDGLQASALQMAFPGSSGLYYSGGEKVKKAVKFDGKRFLPPGGHWNDIEYFVTLGNRTMNYPFGSYENASKQFERSVNAVQQMLGGGMLTGGPLRSRRAENGSVKTGAHTHSLSPATNGHNGPVAEKPEKLERREPESQEKIVGSLQERERLLKSAGRHLSPIEQQFVDLARISTGKDTIIEQQREETARHRATIENVNRELTKAHDESDRLSKRIIGQEEELSILRRLSADQTYMCDKVNDLTKRLSDREQELNNVRNDLSEKLRAIRNENSDLQKRINAISADLSTRTERVQHLEESLKLKQMDYLEMELELKRLRTLAKRVDLESLNDIESYAETLEENRKVKEINERLHDDLAKQRECHTLFEKNALENARLIERNTDLEARHVTLQRQLEGINEKWRESCTKREEEWSTKRSELELEKGELRRQLAEMQTMFEGATRDVAETTRRLDEVKAARDEFRRHLDSAEYKHQEQLSATTRALTDQLREAEQRAADMVALVSSLTSDAKGSRRDVADLL